MKILSNSELATFRRCRRKWWLTFIRRKALRRRSEVGTSQLGTWVHGGLQEYYEYLEEEKAGEALQELKVAALEARPDQADEIDKQYRAVQIMLEGYFQWLAETGTDAGLEVVEAEMSRRVDLPDVPVTLVAKQDLHVVKEGKPGYVDHKTVGDLTGPVRREPLNTQFLHYHLVEALLGKDNPPLGGWKNMLKRSKRTARAKPPFYARVEHFHTAAQLDSYWRRLHGEIKDILEAEWLLQGGGDHHFVAYPNPTRDCDWDCPFLAVCPMLDSNERAAEEMLERDYVNGDPLARYNEESE